MPSAPFLPCTVSLRAEFVKANSDQCPSRSPRSTEPAAYSRVLFPESRIFSTERTEGASACHQPPVRSGCPLWVQADPTGKTALTH